MLDALYKDVKSKMDGALSKLVKDLATIRSGRASLKIFDNVKVDYYGTPTPINQVAGMANPEPNLITIQPWEANMLPAVEKAILAANLGFTPSNDGQILRISIPPLTEDRRKEYAKLASKHGEACKTAIRNIRRDINDSVKKLEKSKEISQDEMHSGLDEIQKITDGKVKKADDLVKAKEKEILSL